MAKIEDILAIERIDAGIFRGAGIDTFMQRTFGGQVAGQALRAAVSTVPETQVVHSLHGYFINPGTPKIPTIYMVDSVRDGRSFCTRRVTAVQEGKTIFVMAASFHVETDEGIEHQDQMMSVIPPEEIPVPDISELPESHRAFLKEWEQWDIRVVPDDKVTRSEGLASQQKVWFRCVDHLPDDQSFHVCTLAYMSDMTLLGSSKVPHRDVRTQDASLDHAMWFLRPFRADEWLLYDQSSPSATAGRALTQGRIFDSSGRLVASVVQEGLSRILRDGAQSVPIKFD